MKKSIENSEHYNWGSTCSRWHLVKTENLGVIQGSMSKNTEEQRHYPNFSQQFFDILKGKTAFLVESKTVTVNEGEGVHIDPKIAHQFKNDTFETSDFPVIPRPNTKRDRIDEPITKNA